MKYQQIPVNKSMGRLFIADFLKFLDYIKHVGLELTFPSMHSYRISFYSSVLINTLGREKTDRALVMIISAVPLYLHSAEIFSIKAHLETFMNWFGAVRSSNLG